MSDAVRVLRDGQLTVITIDRSEAANALDPAASFALADRLMAEARAGGPHPARRSARGARVETGCGQGLGLPGVEQALAAQDAWPALQAMRRSADAREGARAFAEQRSPAWTAG